MDKKDEIYRREVVERISKPDQLNDYIKVPNPRLWMILIVIALLVVGLLMWGMLGTIESDGVVYYPMELLFSYFSL